MCQVLAEGQMLITFLQVRSAEWGAIHFTPCLIWKNDVFISTWDPAIILAQIHHFYTTTEIYNYTTVAGIRHKMADMTY